MRRRIITVLALGALLVSVSGCVGAISATTLTPKVSPPVIGKEGVLSVAVDLSYPPFAGSVKDQKAGIDVDVAAAVAEQLGLKLELVDATPAVAMGLIKDGSVDLMLGGLTVESAVASQVAFAGTYISDAPAVFAMKGGVVSIGALGTKRIAVQKGTLAYWILVDKYGESSLLVVPSFDEAFKSVKAGTADVAAGDALLGAYLMRGYTDIQFAFQLGSAYPIGVGVSQAKPDLETQIRSVLDKLSSQGVLQTIRSKWIGELPPLKVTDTSGASETSPTVETTPTP